MRWKYSNLAYSIAGMVIEAVSGQTWADYVQQHIYQPLGMTSSSVDQNVRGLAVGYSRLMPDDTRGHESVHRRARHGRGHRHHLDGGGHGEVRVGAVPEGRRWAAARS